MAKTPSFVLIKSFSNTIWYAQPTLNDDDWNVMS